MVKILFNLNLIVSLLSILSVAAQCQPTTQLTDQPASILPTPTIRLIPPIQPGDGSDLIDKLLERGIIRIGIRVWPSAEFSPPAFRGISNAATGGALNGYEIDLAHLIADGLGLELELVEAYPPAIISGDWQDQWDVALASLAPFDQISDLTFSQPYAYIPMGLLTSANEDDIRTLEHLANQKVGVLEHSPYQRLLASDPEPLTVQAQPLLPALPPNMQAVPVSNLAKAIHQLSDSTETQTADFVAIFGPTPVFEQAVNRRLAVKLVPQAQVIGFQPLAVAVVPQEELGVERLIFEINKILARARHDGTLAEIYFRWYGQDFSQIK